ncbi:Ppx/GppA family phosphatase [Jatrophihabitans telluris]|uniref:Ppx/GppA family phosphatase n=1 Tax=Jatrophihabitans telluris TaxID=2038343 RepID=A0ABY4R0U5_9ACTN|nr:Ppx/GppA phosphatase family protein [Jatrophihabitans telluris]UQX89384.1 Ppx/GppA family phosphatase [Jatrophihabitans telluris]
MNERGSFGGRDADSAAGEGDRSVRVAGIDCGTNSIRLLIADGNGPALTDVHREMRVVRLGEGVDRTGRLSDAALERTRAALVDYVALIEAQGVSRVRMVATSASRDAANADEFRSMVQAILGVEPEVISGVEEAALSFTGAVAGLPGVVGEGLLVADIGGGSTELVLGSPARGIVSASFSMDVGCVRMTERHLHDDPPTPAQIAATTSDLETAFALAAQEVPVREAVSFVGVAGTVTTIAAIALGLPAYDPRAIHGSVISFRDVSAVTQRLLSMTRAERAALPVMHPGRVDVIGAGALILRCLMEFVGAAEVIVSEHDILDGIALSLL